MNEVEKIRFELWSLYENAEDLDEDVLQARTELLDSLIRLLEVERFVPAPPESSARGRYRSPGSGEGESLMDGVHHPPDGG